MTNLTPTTNNDPINVEKYPHLMSRERIWYSALNLSHSCWSRKKSTFIKQYFSPNRIHVTKLFFQLYALVINWILRGWNYWHSKQMNKPQYYGIIEQILWRTDKFSLEYFFKNTTYPQKHPKPLQNAATAHPGRIIQPSIILPFHQPAHLILHHLFTEFPTDKFLILPGSIDVLDDKWKGD